MCLFGFYPLCYAFQCAALALLLTVMLSPPSVAATPAGENFSLEEVVAAKVTTISETAHEEEAQKHYPFGLSMTQSVNRLELSLPDPGHAMARVVLGGRAVGRSLILAGSSRQHERGRVITLSGLDGQGGTASLDGLLMPEAGGRARFIGAWTVTALGLRHREIVTLRLAPGAADADWSWVQPDRRQPSDAPVAERPLLSEPSEWIGGVPVFTQYNVTLQVRLEGGISQTLKGTLLLSKITHNDLPAVGLTLATDGDAMPGWSYWIIGEAATPGKAKAPGLSTGEAPADPAQSPLNPAASGARTPSVTALPLAVQPPDVESSAHAGHLQIRLLPTSSPVPRSSSWMVAAPNDPAMAIPVPVGSATIELDVRADQVSGHIVALGTNLAVGGIPSAEHRFAADFSGQPVGKAETDAVAAVVGRRQFDGQWQLLDPAPAGASATARFTLSQNADGRVHGQLPDGAVIDGRVTGRRLAELSWQHPGGTAGHGFLATTPTQSLAGGLWQDQPGQEPTVWLAEQPPLPWDPATDDKARQLTDDETRQLKYLGQDLARAGKTDAAINILNVVVDHFQIQKKPLDAAITVTTLIETAFVSGNYPALINGLTAALKIKYALGHSQVTPTKRDFSRSPVVMAALKSSADHYTKTLGSTVHTFGLLSEAFGRGADGLEQGGIGVDTDRVADGLAVTKVTNGMPAAAAGIRPGDLLTTVDQQPLAGLSLDQATARLRGAVGTTVVVTTKRGGEPRELRMTRAALVPLGGDRRAHLPQYLAELQKVTADLQADLEREQQRIEAGVVILKCEQQRIEARGTSPECERQRIEVGGKNQILTFEDLIASIEGARRLGQEHWDQVSQLGDRVFDGVPAVAGLFRRSVAAFAPKPEGGLSPEQMATMAAIDQEVEALKGNPSVSSWDNSLLELAGTLIGSLSVLDTAMAGAARNTRKAKEVALAAPLPEKNAEAMQALAGRLEVWRKRLQTDAAKIGALEQGKDFYRNWVDMLVRLDLPEQALVASETARARAFAERLRPPQAATVAPQGERQPPAPSLRLDEIEALIEEGNQTVVEYFFTDNNLLIWVLQPHQGPDGRTRITLIHRTPGGTELSASAVRADAQALIRILDAPDGQTIKEKEQETADILRRLYTQLIQPIAHLLPGEPEQPVVIIPHDDLFKVPFAALLHPDDPGSAKKEKRYLVADHALIYTASLDVLRNIRQRHQSRPRVDDPRMLAVIASEFPPGTVDAAQQPLRPLTWEPSTLAHLRQLYPRLQEFNGPEATKDALSQQMTEADVLLFLTHAEANEDHPQDSYLALSDGKLTLGSLSASNLQLNAQLVILAACQTGRGQQSADGVYGLSRMMAAAGASNLLTSLWQVPEKTTLDLIYEFNRRWRQDGKSMAVALQQSQLRFSRRWPDQVVFWAGFALTGDNQ